jgi:tRNA pseudouridine55 synthase
MNIPEDGILLIDKPKGITSFDVIRLLRKKTGVWKMGHAGTLDPNATGLMIIAIGSATKKLQEFLGLPKKYVAEILLGTKTDSGDVDGKILEQIDVPELLDQKIKEVLKNIEGDIELPVPIYSAIKRKGKPLYEYARSGQSIEIPIKTMGVTSATLLSHTGKVLEIEFDVKSGTYIRSLAEEIAKQLGTIAILQNLRRTSIGEFTIDKAMKID